jgi:hypothetical protein
MRHSVQHGITASESRGGTAKDTPQKYTRLNAEHFRLRSLPNRMFTPDGKSAVKLKRRSHRPLPATVIQMLRV